MGWGQVPCQISSLSTKRTTHRFFFSYKHERIPMAPVRILTDTETSARSLFWRGLFVDLHGRLRAGTDSPFWRCSACHFDRTVERFALARDLGTRCKAPGSGTPRINQESSTGSEQ